MSEADQPEPISHVHLHVTEHQIKSNGESIAHVEVGAHDRESYDRFKEVITEIYGEDCVSEVSSRGSGRSFSGPASKRMSGTWEPSGSAWGANRNPQDN